MDSSQWWSTIGQIKCSANIGLLGAWAGPALSVATGLLRNVTDTSCKIWAVTTLGSVAASAAGAYECQCRAQGVGASRYSGTHSSGPGTQMVLVALPLEGTSPRAYAQ
eukprot:546281-Rhodomonas_salina.1